MSKAIILAGCNGVGKSTVIKILLKDEELKLTRFPRHTTRAKRESETHGVEYFFVDVDEFEALVEADNFIDIDEFPSGKYGTSRSHLREHLNNSYLIFEVDPENALVLKAAFTEMGISTVDIFIQPMETADLRKPEGLESVLGLLRERLEEKKLSEYVIQDRIHEATTRLFMGDQFTHIVINREDQLEKTVQEIKAIIGGNK